MLVLTRREGEEVVLGDEVTVTVEQICGADGQRIYGARARFGFELPRYVSVRRGEWRPKSPTAGPKNRHGSAPPPVREGSLVAIPSAAVRLRIQVPQKIPVCLNGSPTAGREAAEKAERNATVVHHVTCRQEDRITICRNMTVVTTGFEIFVWHKSQPEAFHEPELCPAGDARESDEPAGHAARIGR